MLMISMEAPAYISNREDGTDNSAACSRAVAAADFVNRQPSAIY